MLKQATKVEFREDIIKLCNFDRSSHYGRNCLDVDYKGCRPRNNVQDVLRIHQVSLSCQYDNYYSGFQLSITCC